MGIKSQFYLFTKTVKVNNKKQEVHMKIKSRFVCEVCGIEFDKADGCIEHEKDCVETKSFTCECCGETRHWNPRDFSENIFNESISHHINIGDMGYGSKLDGEHIKVNVCDKCLCGCLETFKIKTWERDEWGNKICPPTN